MDDRSHLTQAPPTASPEEAAAVMAAVAQFMRDTGPQIAPAHSASTPGMRSWHRAALEDGISRQPGAIGPWE